MAGQLQAVKDGLVLSVERVAAAADHPADRLLKPLAEAPRVQFRHKKLCNVLRQIHVSVAPAGHVQRGQGIGAHIGKAQRLQQPRERQTAPRQLAIYRPVHRANGAMIEHHFASLLRLLLHITSAIRHRVHQLVQQAQVQRFSEPCPMQRLRVPTEIQQALWDFNMLAQPVSGGLADCRLDQRKQTIESRHGGQGSGDKTSVYQSPWDGVPQAKKNAGFIPFFLAGESTTSHPVPLLGSGTGDFNTCPTAHGANGISRL